MEHFKKPTPFIKWMGGKRQVIKNYLINYLPKTFNNYFEPFLGGASMLFYLMPKKAFVNDINRELIQTYNTIKTAPIELMNELDKMYHKHSSEFFYKMRKKTFENSLKNSARFIYLNKTCFNGMYRVNSKNEFNVPFSNKTKEKLNLYENENILLISQYLNNNDITFDSDNFSKQLLLAKENDFVFCDPPYDYDVENGFDAYTKNSFGKEGQIKLFKILDELNDKKVKWMHTNHDTKLIRELYKDYTIIPMLTNRNINSNPNKRKNTGKEVVIINYENK